MKIKHLLAVFTVILSINSAFSQDKKFKVHTVAFYNFENLFDTINDPDTYDEEYTPVNGWTKKNYKKKLDNLSRVLIELGTSENQKNSPVIIGACEIENRRVLEDLVKHPALINKGYKVVHFDSPDKRGIDVALLYQKKHFKVVSASNIPLMIYQGEEKASSKKEKEEVKEYCNLYLKDNRNSNDIANMDNLVSVAIERFNKIKDDKCDSISYEIFYEKRLTLDRKTSASRRE